jgi:hypothetical protein
LLLLLLLLELLLLLPLPVLCFSVPRNTAQAVVLPCSHPQGCEPQGMQPLAGPNTSSIERPT